MYFLNKQESSAGVDLDIFEKQLILNSADPLYHLDVSFWNKSSLLIFVGTGWVVCCTHIVIVLS